MAKYHDQLAVQFGAEDAAPSPVSAVKRDAQKAAWVKSPTIPRQKRWEIAAIVGISTLLHAGGVVMGMTVENTPNVREKLPQRVKIQVARPKVEKPVTPPKVPEQKPVEQLRAPPKQRLQAAPQPTTPQPEVPPQEVPEVVDTGSSAPSAEDGTLFAGSGGLGVAPLPPPAPPAPVAPTVAPIIQAREGANYLKNPRPAYPGIAQRNGWQGTTLLRVQVKPSGKPAGISVQRSSGKDVLDEAAIAAVRNWVFVPANQGGVPIGGVVTVPIVFRLQ